MHAAIRPAAVICAIAFPSLISLPWFVPFLRSLPATGLLVVRSAIQSGNPMKIDGIKGCYEKTRGMFYFARMCSKIRLHAAGKLLQDYFDMLGNGFDGRTCRYLSVRYEDVK